MNNLTSQEQQAMLAALRSMIEIVDSIGLKKPFADYSQEDALRVVEAILTGWTQAMADYHHRASYTPQHRIQPLQPPKPLTPKERLAAKIRASF
ncbi:MAG: DUF6511 domain-containing protein [Gammaproteobacteria bacterium]|nr:DUF6511 domain-containing protein [Gammaproteobacteria bacterium]